MPTRYLLDANTLIALTVEEHEHHARTSRWAASLQHFAVCPVVEGALVRFLVRTGERADTAVAVLRGVAERRGYELWPDDISYVHADLAHVRGHRQVTDAYLAALARSRRDTRLATLDEGLAADLPDVTFLVP